MRVSTTTGCGDGDEVTGKIEVRNYLDEGTIFLVAHDLSGLTPHHATVALTHRQAQEVAKGLLVAAFSPVEVNP